MVGLYFGKSRWGAIPQTLGLTVDGGVMFGQWQGMRVDARFYDRDFETVRELTDVGMPFDPPLGVEGLETPEPWTRIVDLKLSADFQKRAEGLGLYKAVIGDGGMRGTWFHYESAVERYRGAFDLFAWAAHIILDRRAKNPPPWEIEIGETWPALAQHYGLQLDVRRGAMAGTVRGRPTQVGLGYHRNEFTTCIEIAVPVPAGCELSLARQDGDGLFAKLFRGQDVVVGDPEFDAAFVIRGEPESFVRAALTPAARAHILELTHAGCSITLKNSQLVAWTKERIVDRDRLDELMKTAYAAALAMCPEPTEGGAPAPYR